jgi:hypothetical protein
MPVAETCRHPNELPTGRHVRGLDIQTALCAASSKKTVLLDHRAPRRAGCRGYGSHLSGEVIDMSIGGRWPDRRQNHNSLS